MELFYTDERNAQIVISIMKAYGIRKVIVSPGTTNVCLVGSIQNDDFFELYSCVDERSAAYMATGLAAESGEIVALSCTGATASRNYMPALTEAYYRHLPILVITSSRRNYKIGHNIDQVTDRTLLPRDVAKISVQMPLVTDKDSEWACVIAANKAISELRHRGDGPCHINLETNYSDNFNTKILPETRVIRRYMPDDEFPVIAAQRVTIVVGAHGRWSSELTAMVDLFCERFNAIVLCDLISNYKGKYGIFGNLTSCQKGNKTIYSKTDLLIHIGDITSSDYLLSMNEVWRVNPDGEIRDTFGKLSSVFECKEIIFFKRYLELYENKKANISFYHECEKELNSLKQEIPDFPFSNIWMAKQLAKKLPDNAVLHLAIRNSLRSWNFFDIPDKVNAFSNTGGFGIDGCLSSTIGASLFYPEKIYYCMMGDLAFFYDLNSIGNRHIGKNLRILLVNNGTAMEMKFSGNLTSMFGKDTDSYLAASGHFGNKSENLVKNYVENLGFMYYAAHSKEEFSSLIDIFTSPCIGASPILIEAFTNSIDEDEAFHRISSIKTTQFDVMKDTTKKLVKGVIGEKGVDCIKKMIRK